MRFVSTVFYMILSILGLSVVSLGGLIAVQLYRGKVTGRDLHSVMRVIGGTERIMIPNAAYERFLEFAKDEEKARRELELNRGLPETRLPGVIREQEAMAALRESLDIANRQIAGEKKRVEDMRAEVEAQKTQVANLRRALDDERARNLTVASDQATANLRRTLAEMDAGNIAAYLGQIVRDPSLGGPGEAARIIRDHLRADFAAEVLGEMPAPDRQQVIPLLENRFAGVPPDAVVKIFADNDLGPGEQAAYMMRMNPGQALGVYLRLSPAAQEQIAPQLLRNN